MAWKPKAMLAFANDLIMASTILDPESDTYAAIQGVADALISQAIAADPTLAAHVTGAATAAVNAELAAKDILLGSQSRSPRTGRSDSFRVRTAAGKVPFRVDGTDTWIGSTRIRPSRRVGFFGRGGKIAAVFDPSAWEWYIPRLRIDRLTGPGVPGAVKRVHVHISAGQSNMAGQNMTTAQADPADSRIFQYGVTANAIVTATVPLDNRDTTKIGLSPATVFAREHVRDIPADEVVLVVPASRSGSSLLGDISAGCWKIDYAGSNPRLYSLMWAQVQAALAAAAVRWPGAEIVVDSFQWLQGEAESGFTQAQYAAAFDALATDIRSKLALPNLRIIVGGMVPERTASVPGASNIRLAHVDTPRRLEYAAYFDGIPNTGNYPASDAVHYSREGTIRMGKGMYKRWQEIAPFNAVGNIPLPPATVTATRVNGTVTATWTHPHTRVTAFPAQYSTDNGATWTAFPAPATPLELTATQTGLTAPVVLVRVATVNEKAIADGGDGRSQFTTPVPAIGV